MDRDSGGARRLPLLATTLAAVIGATLFVFPTWVEGTSMESTLFPGELIIVQRVALQPIQRGEIVVFHPPAANATGLFIKRVIGLPGETVSIDGNHVFVDGRQLAEPYLPAGTKTPISVAYFTMTVPPNSIFVLGDHRSNSWDSRAFGCVPLSAITGRAWFGFGPTGSPGSL